MTFITLSSLVVSSILFTDIHSGSALSYVASDINLPVEDRSMVTGRGSGTDTRETGETGIETVAGANGTDGGTRGGDNSESPTLLAGKNGTAGGTRGGDSKGAVVLAGRNGSDGGTRGGDTDSPIVLAGKNGHGGGTRSEGQLQNLIIAGRGSGGSTRSEYFLG